MVMIEDKITGKVLVQDRIKLWKGWSFSGWHVEQDEGFVDSAVREVKEETALECDLTFWAVQLLHILGEAEF